MLLTATLVLLQDKTVSDMIEAEPHSNLLRATTLGFLAGGHFASGIA